MIGIIHSNWEGDIVLEKGDLENLIEGKTLFGEIANYKEIGELLLSPDRTKLAPGYYFNLKWDKNEPLKYHFEIYAEGIEKLKENNYVHGRYDNGSNGSKLGIYGPGKDELTKDNIEFAIQMIRLNMENKS